MDLINSLVTCCRPCSPGPQPHHFCATLPDLKALFSSSLQSISSMSVNHEQLTGSSLPTKTSPLEVVTDVIGVVDDVIPITPRNGTVRNVESMDLFSEPRSLEDDGMMNFTLGSTMDHMSIRLPRRQFTKLEVVQADQIDALLFWHHIFVCIGIVYTTVVIALMNTVYSRIWYTQDLYGWDFDLRDFRVPTALNWFNQVATIPMFLYIVTLFTAFSIRIFRLKIRSRTKEQIWIIFLLFSMVLYLNPFSAIVKMHDVLLHQSEPWLHWRSKPWCVLAIRVFDVLQISGFTATTVFYVWATIHSYRMLETKITHMFYLPKMLVLAIYVTSKVVVNVSYRVVPSELAFASFLAMISTYRTADFWYKPGVWYASLTLAFEILLTLYIMWEYRRTRRVLQNSDYLKYRTQQIGFRFFIYHNLTFYIVFITLYLALLIALPNGANVFVLRFNKFRMSLFRLHDLQFGIQIMLLAYVTAETYVNLPSSTDGIFGLIVPKLAARFSNRRLAQLEPITYRKREPLTMQGDVSDLRVNCFVMQTHVTLFNFAWLVYYWNTPKAEKFQIKQDVFKFTFADYIEDEATDTHVLVVDGDDRIVIAFKGTTSSRNLKTDINMFYFNARALLPTVLEGVEESYDNDDAETCTTTERGPDRDVIRQSLTWRRAKIHKGFAVAYAAIAQRLLAVVRKLQSERRRPVYLTGHSLGGALATVCSLDLYLTQRLTSKEIFVSSFGAPRVGNRQFSSVYNACIPIHWRIVVAPDVVAKLPKVGYKHVGKKVLITVDGDLFIDPNSLELNMWTGDVASILYHRKASYLLAMRAWCERHHGDEYVPEFWPFPVSEEDTKRFQHAMARSEFTSSMRPNIPTDPERIRELDAMVEALGKSEEIDVNNDIAQKWATLVSKALQTIAIVDHDHEAVTKLE